MRVQVCGPFRSPKDVVGFLWQVEHRPGETRLAILAACARPNTDLPRHTRSQSPRPLRQWGARAPALNQRTVWGGELPFLALPLPFCQILMPLLAVLQS